MFSVIVWALAGASRSTPPKAVPPSSLTWKVNVAYGVPLAFGLGTNLNLLRSTSLARIVWPNVTGTSDVPLLNVSVPLVGQAGDPYGQQVVRRYGVGGIASCGSVKPKSPLLNV